MLRCIKCVRNNRSKVQRWVEQFSCFPNALPDVFFQLRRVLIEPPLAFTLATAQHTKLVMVLRLNLVPVPCL